MYELVPTSKFRKSFKKFRKKHHQLLNRTEERLDMLREDPRNPKLKTHKLTGNLEGCWAASINYEYRVVFTIDEEDQAVYLLAIGTHEEVY